MGDADLRELERRFRETGSVEDEAAYLLERVRVGELDPARLRIASDLSVSGVGPTSTPTPSLDAGAEVWIKYLRCWPREVALRLCAAAWTEMELTRDSPETRTALYALEEWLTCPCEKHAAVVEEGRFALPLDPESPFLAVKIAMLLVDTPWIVEGERPTSGTLEAVWARLRSELLTWVLGYSDPVRERVEARQGKE